MTHDENVLAEIFARCGVGDLDRVSMLAAVGAAKAYAEVCVGRRDTQLRQLRAKLTHRNELLRDKKRLVRQLAGQLREARQ